MRGKVVIANPHTAGEAIHNAEEMDCFVSLTAFSQ